MKARAYCLERFQPRASQHGRLLRSGYALWTVKRVLKPIPADVTWLITLIDQSGNLRTHKGFLMRSIPTYTNL